jgi:hypothetical protein
MVNDSRVRERTKTQGSSGTPEWVSSPLTLEDGERIGGVYEISHLDEWVEELRYGFGVDVVPPGRNGGSALCCLQNGSRGSVGRGPRSATPVFLLVNRPRRRTPPLHNLRQRRLVLVQFVRPSSKLANKSRIPVGGQSVGQQINVQKFRVMFAHVDSPLNPCITQFRVA